MSNFNWFVDGTIVLLYLAGTLTAGLYVRRFITRLDDFLVAGRKVDLYLGIASLSATEFGIATCMANAELGFKYGFAGITPGIAIAVSMLVIGLTGFCIKPLREQNVITIPELFQKKFGERVRWASGVVIVLGGLLNMGVFLRQAGDFLAVVCGFEMSHLELIMTIILAGIALYTILGGMLAVLVTDYIQFVVMGIGLISVTLLIVFKFGWGDLNNTLQSNIGSVAYNPFQGGTYGIDRILLDLLTGFASVLTWQTMISRVLSAKDVKTGQRIYQGTSPFFLVRFTIPVILGIAALHYFGPEAYEENVKLAMPGLLSAVVPVGLIGLLVASMLAADMSTNSSYMIAWSSVIYNDIMKPIHQGLWTHAKAIRWNRILIALIGIFLLLYGLWYPLKGDLWVYMQVTGTVYLSSMSVILIAACYWDRANNWGAIAAIIVGSVIPIGFLIMQQLEATAEIAAAVGPYKAGVATFVFTGGAMVIGSMMKGKMTNK